MSLERISPLPEEVGANKPPTESGEGGSSVFDWKFIADEDQTEPKKFNNVGKFITVIWHHPLLRKETLQHRIESVTMFNRLVNEKKIQILKLPSVFQ